MMIHDKERTCSSIFLANPWVYAGFHGFTGNAMRCFQLHWVHFAAFAWGGPAGSTANGQWTMTGSCGSCFWKVCVGIGDLKAHWSIESLQPWDTQLDH